MSAVAEARPFPALPPAATGPVRLLSSVARWLGVFSDAAVRIATWGAIGAALVAFGVEIANVFCRYVLRFSLIGAEEVASYAFLWAIWMGISVAIRRGAVTVITVVSHHGPQWWQRSLQTFSAVALGILLAYCCYWSTRYAMSADESLGTTSTALGIRYVYPIASMPVGYYFITLHYLAMTAHGAVRLASGGAPARQNALRAAGGALVVGAIFWLMSAGLLALGANRLVVLGLMFVFLTLTGMPVVFMLSVVGILSAVEILGLSFYPVVSPLFPFKATQEQMGLGGATEFIVILMFLIVAEVMNASGMSERLIRWAATLVGHLRGGMAYVCQLTSVMVSGISGSAQADAAVMTPLLVPAMEREGYKRDFGAAVVAGASIKGPVGPLSIMIIAYGVIVDQDGVSASIKDMQAAGIFLVGLLFVAQAAVITWIARRAGYSRRPFVGARVAAQATGSALPILAIPVIIVGGIWSGVFTITEAAAVAVLVTLLLAFFWYSTLSFRDVPRVFAAACVETGVVMLLLGDSAILAKNLTINSFGQTVTDFFTDLTSSTWVFLLVVNLILLAVGIFIEPLPALLILAPFLAPVAVEVFAVDPLQFAMIMILNLVLALIHPPIGLVLFLVSSISKVSVERLSIRIIPWFLVSLGVLGLITFLPSEFITWLPDLVGGGDGPAP